MRDPAGYFWRLGRGSASVWWPRGIKCTGSLPASTPSCAGMSCHAPYWTRGVTPGRHFSQHPWALEIARIGLQCGLEVGRRRETMSRE